jgi:hypothetical protein
MSSVSEYRFVSASVSPTRKENVSLNSIPSTPLARGSSELGGRGAES